MGYNYYTESIRDHFIINRVNVLPSTELYPVFKPRATVFTQFSVILGKIDPINNEMVSYGLSVLVIPH